MDCWAGDPGDRGPLRHALGLPIESDVAVAPSVSRLLNIGGPVAVAWLIAATVVPPVNGMPAGRPQPHVGKECGKISPSLTDGDTAAAVVGPPLELRIGAPLDHLTPDSELLGSLASLGVAMLGGADGSLLVAPAPAALAFAVAKACSKHDASCAALAVALPQRLSVTPADQRALENGPSAEGLAGQVGWLGHRSAFRASEVSAARLAQGTRRGWPPGAQPQQYRRAP